MNRLRLLPLLFLSLPPLLLPPIGLEAADGNADPAADTPVYRLKTIPEEASKAQSIDLSGLILPAGSLVNGVRVVADGKAIPFRLHDNLELAVAPVPGAKEFTVEFGFPREQKRDSWPKSAGECPPAERLRLFFFPGRQPCTPAQYITQRTAEYERRNAWKKRSHPQNAYRYVIERATGLDLLNRGEYVRSAINRIRQRKRRMLSAGRWDRQRARAEAAGLPAWALGERADDAAKRRLTGHLVYICNDLAKAEQDREKIRRDANGGPERELEQLATRKARRILEPSDVQLTVRPPETQEFYSARFHGFLHIPADGRYEFELNANCLARMKIDGQLLLSHTGDGSGPAVRQIAGIELKRGSREFELLNRVNTGAGRLTLRMRPAGTEEFRLLNSEDFTPAPVLYPNALETAAGEELPLLSRSGRCLIFADKRTSFELQHIDLLNEAAKRLDFEVGQLRLPVAELPATVAIPSGRGEGGFRLLDPTGKLPEFPVTPINRPQTMLPAPPDIALKLWLPAFLYDRETLTATVEISSKLPVPCSVGLKIAERGGTIRTETISLPGKEDGRVARFTPDVICKLPLPLNGDGEKGERVWDLTLSIPGFEFARETIRITPVRSAQELVSTPEGLRDRDGARVILLLHHPTLSELRNWELPRKLAGELKPERKYLVIGEEFGEFVDELGRQLSADGKELEFLPLAGNNLPLFESLPMLWREIPRSMADRALVLLPCRRHSASQESWEQERNLAAILEKLNSNPAIERITLAYFPEPDDENDAAREEMLNRLIREFGIEYLDLSETQSCLESPEAFILPERSGESSLHPVGAASDLARILAGKLRRHLIFEKNGQY